VDVQPQFAAYRFVFPKVLGACATVRLQYLCVQPAPVIPAFRDSWHLKRTEICIEVTFHSPPPTPLLPALTLSAGEHKVSGGEFEVSRQVGLPHNLRAPRSKAQNGLPLFLAAFSRLLSRRHGGATSFLLRVHGPYRCLRDSRLS
jgi:hypothetical protein